MSAPMGEKCMESLTKADARGGGSGHELTSACVRILFLEIIMNLVFGLFKVFSFLQPLILLDSQPPESTGSYWKFSPRIASAFILF